MVPNMHRTAQPEPVMQGSQAAWSFDLNPILLCRFLMWGMDVHVPSFFLTGKFSSTWLELWRLQEHLPLNNISGNQKVFVKGQLTRLAKLRVVAAKLLSSYYRGV